MPEDTHSPIGAGTAEMVEQMGIFLQSLGVPRAAGQMLGYLLACDPPEQSVADIRAATGMSAASVSSSARLLIGIGSVERRHRIGDRKTYYRLRDDFWIESARQKLGMFHELATIGRRITAAGAVDREEGIREMVAFADFWQAELPAFTQRWEAKRAALREER
jgi:hypothetical protein